MNRFVIGLVIGIAVSVAFVLLAMVPEEAFRTMTLKYGVENGTGVVATERFVILFDGVTNGGAGAHMITYAGREGSLPAYWSGYCAGGAGDQTGLTSYHTYDPHMGKALLYYFGRLFFVEDSGRFLRVQDCRIPLGARTVVVSVGADGRCKDISNEEAGRAYRGLDGWFKDDALTLRPLR